MADNPSSRFVSQTELDEANARREEQWKAAYARLGQEPPPKQVDEAYDGRTLFEKLAANKAAKQEEWEQKNKLSSQFRALEPDEITFLDTVALQKFEEEQKVKQADNEAISGFKAAVAAREASSLPPIASAKVDGTTDASTSTKPTTSTKATVQVNKPSTSVKGGKPLIKGVVVASRKRAKPGVDSSKPAKEEDKTKEEESGGDAKRRKKE